MASSLVTFAAEEGEHAAQQAGMTPEMIGVLALVILLTLLFITLAFRNVRTRH